MSAAKDFIPKARDIYQAIDRVAPFHTALHFDNVGLLVGDPEKSVRRIMFALDVTLHVVEEAIKKKIDLLISHHPVIFQPIKMLSADSVPFQLAQAGITVLSCHTNLDAAAEVGVNFALANALDLTQIRQEIATDSAFFVYSGNLPETMQATALISYVKEKLSLNRLNAKLGSRKVRRIYFCSGAGGEFLAKAAQLGAAAYLTGELKYHEEVTAEAFSEMTVIAAGHYETEKMFYQPLLRYLHFCFPKLEMSASLTDKHMFAHF